MQTMSPEVVTAQRSPVHAWMHGCADCPCAGWVGLRWCGLPVCMHAGGDRPHRRRADSAAPDPHARRARAGSHDEHQPPQRRPGAPAAAAAPQAARAACLGHPCACAGCSVVVLPSAGAAGGCAWRGCRPGACRLPLPMVLPRPLFVCRVTPYYCRAHSLFAVACMHAGVQLLHGRRRDARPRDAPAPPGACRQPAGQRSWRQPEEARGGVRCHGHG